MIRRLEASNQRSLERANGSDWGTGETGPKQDSVWEHPWERLRKASQNFLGQSWIQRGHSYPELQRVYSWMGHRTYGRMIETDLPQMSWEPHT